LVLDTTLAYKYTINVHLSHSRKMKNNNQEKRKKINPSF